MEPTRLESSKSILILKAHPFSLAATEVFLRNRGWRIYITTNIKEALLQLIQKKYSYVLISVDHSNKKTPMLPQLIRHKFNTVVISFAETPSTLSYNRLSATTNPNKIFAPVTGPAVERFITRYLRNLQSKKTAPANELIYRPAEKSHPRGPTHVFFKGPPQVGRVKTFDISANTSTGQVQTQGTVSPLLSGKVHTAQGFEFSLGQTKTVELQTPLGQVSAPIFSLSPGESPDPEPEAPALPRSSKKSLTEIEYQQRHFNQKKKRSDALDSLIARGTQLSLLGNVDFLDGTIEHKVKNTSHSGCILVESERFSGYIVAALGDNVRFEEKFLSNVKTTLFKYLKDNGEHVTESDAMNIKIKSVNFETWALEYGDFLRTSVHQGNEVAVAFFPRRPVHLILENSQRRDLAAVQLRDLKGDCVVDFDLYLNLKANDKFVLYTPKGGIFYQKQLDRLKAQGITHLHVPKSDSLAVSKYHAQNYLNDLVDAFAENEFSA